jgi:hypothetical protein
MTDKPALINLELEPFYYPASDNLQMRAVIQVHDRNKVAREIPLLIKAEPRSGYGSPKGFAVRIDSWSSENSTAKRTFGIGGLNAVPGLNEAARKLATDTWAAPIVPDTISEPGMPGITAEVSTSDTLRLRLNELDILGIKYTGTLTYKKEAEAELHHIWGRRELNLVAPDNSPQGWRAISINDRAVQTIGEWLKPVAQQYFNQLAGIARAKRIEELEKSIDWERGHIQNYKYSLQESEQKLSTMENELRLILSQPTLTKEDEHGTVVPKA